MNADDFIGGHSILALERFILLSSFNNIGACL